MNKYHHQLQLTMLTLHPPQREPEDLILCLKNTAAGLLTHTDTDTHRHRHTQTHTHTNSPPIRPTR